MKNLQINIILAVILGVLAGFYAADFLYVYEFLGNAFINVLKYVVVPLVFASLVSGIISLGNITLLQKMGFKTLVYFVATTFVASSIGIGLAKLLNPGSGFSVIPEGSAVVSKAMTFKEMFFEIIPQDFMSFISGGNMLFLIIISILIGILIITLGKNIAFPIDELFEGFNEFMMIITNWIIAFSPIGIFGLIAKLIVTTGFASFIPLLKYMGVVLLGLSIHALIILPLIIKLFLRCSPISVAKDVFTSLMTGFTTASSAATLPVLLDDSRNKLKVPNKVASFVLPLGITINMDGTALFQSVAAVFIAQIYGVPLSITSLGIIIFIAIILKIDSCLRFVFGEQV